MLDILYFPSISVGVTGAVLVTTLNSPSPGLHFVCEGGGVMKRVATWTQQPVVRLGFNAPSYNNIIPTASLGTMNLQGFCRSQTVLRAIPSGTQIYLFVQQIGIVSSGTPLVDVYLVGTWQNIN